MSDDNAVSEILIIENSGLGLYFPPNKKVKVYNSEKNLYVNTSWNLGITMIENERFLIINDDILPVKNFCTKILETNILEQKNTGLVGIDTSYIQQNSRTTTSDIKIPNTTNSQLTINRMDKILGTGDWGSAYFGKKESYYEIPKYPAVSRDLALLIDKNVEFAQIEQIAYQSEKKLLKDVKLFDVYEGKNLEEGKKSYAVNFILQDENKTLNDKQIEAIMNKIEQSICQKLGAKVRGK